MTDFLAKTALSFPLCSLFPLACYDTFIWSLRNVIPDNYTGANGHSEGFFFLAFCQKHNRLCSSPDFDSTLLFRCHSYFQNEEDDSKEMTRMSV